MRNVFIVLEEQDFGFADPRVVRVFANQNDAAVYAAKLYKDSDNKSSIFFVECFEVF